jgi:hypothetical protein
MGHVKALEKTSCKYPVKRVGVKVDTVPTGYMNYVQDNMMLGQLPNKGNNKITELRTILQRESQNS